MAQNLYTDLVTPIREFDPSQGLAVSCSVRVTPGNSYFTNITIGKAHYNDIGAVCDCSSIRLLHYGDAAYTHCQKHEYRFVGTMTRAVGKNGRPV